jgi:hypothetical protein
MEPIGMYIATQLRPIMKWTPVAGATRYIVRVFYRGSSTPFVNQPVATSQCVAGVCTQTFSTQVGIPRRAWISGGTYTWDVAAVFSTLQGPFSQPSEFTIYVKPIRPVLMRPIDNETVSPTPDFVWISDASTTTYQIRVYSSLTSAIANFKYDVTRDITNEVQCVANFDAPTKTCSYHLASRPLADVITALQFGWKITETNPAGTNTSITGFFKVQK